MERDAYPSPLNYYNFPKSVCTSVNESICHGIPDMRELREGDIVNIDVSTYVGGFHGDLNEVRHSGEGMGRGGGVKTCFVLEKQKIFCSSVGTKGPFFCLFLFLFLPKRRH